MTRPSPHATHAAWRPRFVVSAPAQRLRRGGGTAGPTPARRLPRLLRSRLLHLCLTRSGQRAGLCSAPNPGRGAGAAAPSAGSLGYSDSMLVVPASLTRLARRASIVKTVDGGSPEPAVLWLDGVSQRESFSSPRMVGRVIEGHLPRTSDGGAPLDDHLITRPGPAVGPPSSAFLTVISP